jgi:hypothetical protein
MHVTNLTYGVRDSMYGTARALAEPGNCDIQEQLGNEQCEVVRETLERQEG